MEIHEIKQKLSLSSILKIYLIKPDKNNMVKCPFHEDNTASLQVNLEKNFYKCHACGKKGDQIQWVQDYGNLTKHEALLKCVDLIGELEPVNYEPVVKIQKPIDEEARIQFLEKMFGYFKHAHKCSQPAKDYTAYRNLDAKKLEIGYNTGQFHHGERKSEELIKQCLEYGILIDKNRRGNTGEIVYTVFGKCGIVFALKNQKNEIVSLYFRNTLDKENAKHFYLKNRQGLYPNYPKPTTKKLILTEAIIDAASLLQIDEIANNYNVLACYGTNGLTEEHLQAIKNLKELEEVVFFFDGDKAGNEAIKKYSEIIREIHESIKISQVETPEYEDVNSLIMGHEAEILIHLIEQRKELPFLFSIEDLSKKIAEIEDLDGVTEITEGDTSDSELAKQNLREKTAQKPTLTNTIEFLKAPELLKRLNIEIGKAGIVGEENSRLLLFLIIISYMNKSPIHAIIQGSSGSGKTLIISRIADLMPQEDVLRFTRITESSLYNWGEFDLYRKIIIIEDLDGLKEDALYALRELISNQFLSSSVSIKDKKGNNKSTRKEVKGQFSSLSATTKGETYEDNMSRSFLIAVDESAAQTSRIIMYQNQKNAGEIDPKTQQNAIQFIQSLIRNLKHYEVINPYATKLQLPEKVHKIRRLNEMYQSVIKQVTFLNQYQREQTTEGKLITTIEDIEQATEILFESIVLKVDELDGSLRQFFEKLKKYTKAKETEFTQREIRQELGISKTQLQRYINSLLELEYIKYKGGFANKGIKYVIDYWDNYQKIRSEIKDFLLKQIEAIRQGLK
jgi:DNA primase